MTIPNNIIRVEVEITTKYHYGCDYIVDCKLDYSQ